MAKVKRKAVMTSLQAAARLSRTALAARLLAHGLYAGQDQIMLLLDEEDGQTPGQLAARLGVRPPTVTKTIGRLQAQGYLEKRGSAIDARQANVSLTERGRDAIRAIEKAVRKTDRLAFKGLDKKLQGLELVSDGCAVLVLRLFRHRKDGQIHRPVFRFQAPDKRALDEGFSRGCGRSAQ